MADGNILHFYFRNSNTFHIFVLYWKYIAPMGIGEKIKKRRSVLRITQQDLAELSEVSLRTIKDIESGKANPSLNTISKIADILGMQLELTIKDMINETSRSIHK